jgi:hypothetical protein
MPSAFIARLRHVCRSLAPFVEARCLGLGDALKLVPAPQVGFERQHVEEALAGRGAGVDRLFGCLQRRTARLDGPVLRRVAGARRGSAAYPPIAAVPGRRRQRQSWAISCRTEIASALPRLTASFKLLFAPRLCQSRRQFDFHFP